MSAYWDEPDVRELRAQRDQLFSISRRVLELETQGVKNIPTGGIDKIVIALLDRLVASNAAPELINELDTARKQLAIMRVERDEARVQVAMLHASLESLLPWVSTRARDAHEKGEATTEAIALTDVTNARDALAATETSAREWLAKHDLAVAQSTELKMREALPARDALIAAEARANALSSKTLNALGVAMTKEMNSGAWDSNEQSVWLRAMACMGNTWRALAATPAKAVAGE